MRTRRTCLGATALLLCMVTPGIADALMWADDVPAWTGEIQNYAGTLLDETTTWWLTGPPDADVDGDGYAWGAGDPDYVAGWRGNDPGASFTVHFTESLVDTTGEDVVLYGYRGSKAAGSVWASADGLSFTEIGSLAGGEPGYLDELWFDLGGLTDVHFIRVLREANGSQTGAFFDAVGALPEPGALVLLAAGALLGRKPGRRTRR